MWGLDPRETGLGLFVPLYLDRVMNKCYCQGGSHKLASSLAREFVRAGGIILDSSQVNKILIENGAVAGVELWEGRTLHSKVVISTPRPAHARSWTWSAAESARAGSKQAVEGWKYDKWSFNTLHVVSRRSAALRAEDPWVERSVHDDRRFREHGANARALGQRRWPASST